MILLYSKVQQAFITYLQNDSLEIKGTHHIKYSALKTYNSYGHRI